MEQELSKSMVLRYGQIIRIHLQSEDNQPQGLLIGKGYTDKNVYLMQYENFQNLNNYRDSLFQILPRGSFEIHDEYLKQTLQQQENLEQRMRAEAKQYQVALQTRFDEEIIFGSEVIFKHVDSEQYLQGSYECSEYSIDAFKLQLANLLSSSVVFKLMPYQTFQQEGHLVYIDEPLIIQHEKSKCKINYVPNKLVFVDQEMNYSYDDAQVEIDLSGFEQFRPIVRKPIKDTKRYEAVINNGSEIFWVLKLHESYDQTREKSRIKPYDLCVFQYTENKGYLSVGGNGTKIILKEMKVNQEIPLDCIWEVKPNQINQKIEIPMKSYDNIPFNRQRNQTQYNGSMLETSIRHRSTIIGGQFHQGYQSKHNLQTKSASKQNKGSFYVLRHYLSGRVITAQRTKGGYQAILNSQDSVDDDQCFELRTAKKGIEDLVQYSYIKIMNQNQELQVQQQMLLLIPKPLRRDSSFNTDEVFYKKLNEEDLDYKKHTLSFQVQKSLHAFQIFKISDEIKKDLLFILSSHELLLQFADILKLPIKEAENRVNTKVLSDIQDLIRQLLAYVMGVKDKNDAETSENIPLKKRQRFMKDLQIVEVTMEIIFFLSYRNGLDRLFKHWKTERGKLKSIYKLSYILIEKMTKNNPQTKLHVSQWLELFLHQAMSIDDISVQTSLSELLDDNNKAISNFITKTSMKRLVDLMKQKVPHEKYLRILSCICMCNGKSIPDNQNHVLALFYQQIQPEFKFQFKFENKKIFVLCHLGRKDFKWRTIKQFYEDSELADDLQSWNYFFSYFNLLGDVCANRNRFAKKYVEESFSLNILCCLIEDPDCTETNAVEPFLKLVHMAFIDCLHYTPIRRIARVREWGTIELKNDILRTHAEDSLLPENNDLKRIMDFIEVFLDKFNYFDAHNRTYNQNLYTILEVLKTTLILGYWQSITNLQHLLPNLFKICSCHKDFIQDIKSRHDFNNLPDVQLKILFERTKSNMGKMNLENILVMRCKMLACEIMEIIFDMETNVRVSKSTQIFKKLLDQINDDIDLATPVYTHKRRISLIPDDPVTPSQQDRKVVRNLLSLQEEHQIKKKSSILYQFLDRRPITKKAEPEIPILTQNIFKSMANVLKREQSKEKDANIYNVDRWIEIFSTLITKRDLFCHVQSDQFTVEVLFAEQSLYENNQMLQFALSLLNRIYGQKRELVQNFEKILIVASGLTHQLSVESRVTRTKLVILNDINILKLTLENQKDLNYHVWRQTSNPKESGIIQDLFYLTQCLKKGHVQREQCQIAYDELARENGLRVLFTEREQNHRLHQSLIKCQDLHESIIAFIEIVKDINQNNSFLMKLLESSYNFLMMVIWNHSDNKNDFMPSFKTLTLHMRFNIGCIDFMRELFTNNKSLLHSESIMSNILVQVTTICNNEPPSSFYKSKLLDFLRVLVVFNSKAIKSNQIMVMAQLQAKQNCNLMFILKEEGTKYHSKDVQKTQVKETSQKHIWNELGFILGMEQYEDYYARVMRDRGRLEISPEFTFMFTYFQIFSLLIEDRNDINAGKCKNMHPYHSLINILSQCGSMWPLKRYLRAYINRLYYNQQDFEGISQLLIEHDIGNMIDDIQSIIEIKVQQDESGIYNIVLQNPVRYTYLYSYVYLCLEETLISLNTIFNQQKFLDDLEDVLNQNFAIQKFKLHLQLLELGTLLSQVKKIWAHCKYIYQFSKIIITIFKSIFKTFDLSLLVTREALIQSLQLKAVTEQVEIIKYSYIDGICIDEQYIETDNSTSTSDPVNFMNSNLTRLVQMNKYWDPQMTPQEFLQDEENQNLLKEQLVESIFEFNETVFNSTEGRPDKVQKTLRKMFLQKPVVDINESLNQNHKRLMKTLSQSGKFQRFLDQEFFQVCERMNRIGEESKRIYQVDFEVISLKEFIQNIIKMNISNPDCFKDDLRIFFLKVLARVITEKNLNNKEKPLALDHWTPEYWSDYKVDIEKQQNFLDECGAAELICLLLKNAGLEQRIALTNELLIFGVAFLLGGNTKCQNSILRRLQEDQSNVMLQHYTTMIKKTGSVVYRNFKIRKAKFRDESKFSVVLIDNYDYFNSTLDMMDRVHQVEMDDTKETAYQKNSLDIMCRSFRFLQLLCENNNVQMKNHIRVQCDQNGTMKLNSMNLIEFTTSQLRIFLKILNKSITNVPNFMLDFLIEVIQLPCLENQLTLCRTTFFEDVCYLSQFFTSEDNLKSRLFETTQDISSLQELYNKILIAVMSVLEGNDDRIYEDLQNKLEPKFLIDIVKRNLEVLQVEDEKDMKKLLELQDETFSEEILKILNVLVIKQKIQHYYKIEQSQWLRDIQYQLDEDENLFQIVSILQRKIRNIEIVYQEKNQIIFFPSHPLFDFLSDQTKDKIMFKINRVTQREKILGLLEVKTMIFNEIEHNYKLNQQTIPVSHKTIQILHNTSAVLSIFVNVFMVLFYNISVKQRKAVFYAEFGEEILLNMLEFCQLFASIIYFVFYIINRAPLCLKMKQLSIVPQKEELSFSKEFEWIQMPPQARNHKKSFIIYLYKLNKSIMKYLFQQILQYGRTFLVRTFRLLKFYLQITYHLAIHEDDFIVISTYLMCSILGIFVKNYFFSLHLFFLFSRISLLKNVFQAISYNATQLIVVALLGVLFVFVFSFTSFSTYLNEIYDEDDPQDHCDTLISCMITLTTSNVIGATMEQWDPIKFFLDTVYFVFFALLFTNIVSGIMIDTFAELRDQRQKIDDDKKNMCFICGVDRVTLEKNQEEFSQHTQTKHYLWNYLFYIYGLIKKDSTEYTGLEYAISDMIDKEDICWFPMTKSDNSMAENIDDLTKRIDNLEIVLEERNLDMAQTLKTLLMQNDHRHDEDKSEKQKIK